MKTSVLRYALLSIAAYSIFLIATLPASVVYGWLKPQLHFLSMQGISGSIWQGQATDIVYQQQSYGAIRWRLKPLRLLLGEFAVKWKLLDKTLTAKGKLDIHFDGDIRVYSTRIYIPLNKLQSVTRDIPVVVDAELRLELRQMWLRNQKPADVDATLRVLNLQSISPVVSEVGSFEATLQSEGQQLKARIKDIDGALQLQATAGIESDGRYQFSGQARLRPQADAALREGLQQIARPAQDGSIRLDYNGRF